MTTAGGIDARAPFPLSAPDAARPYRPIPADLAARTRRLADRLGRAPRAAANGPVVVALPGVDPQLVALAEHLSGQPAARDLARDPRLDDPDAAALLLVDQDSPADAILRALGLMAELGIAFGIVPVDRGPAGRWALAKALLFPAARAAEIRHCDASATESAEVSPALLVASGHGNAVDLGGANAVLCSRGDGGSFDMAGLYPCFGDGRCFRQPLFGRPPESREGLVDPARFRHPLVLLLGCATFPIGDAPFARRGTLPWRMMQSDTLAAVATIGVFFHDSAVEAKLLSLLREGRALGEAVRAFNAWHRGAYGRTSPALEGYGPLVALGNPGFRLDGQRKAMPVAPTAAPFDRTAFFADRETLRDSLTHFGLWRLLLGDARIASDTDLAGVERLVREYLAADAGTGAPTLAMRAAHRLVIKRWRRCQAALLEAASAYVRRTGGFLFHLWQQFYVRDRDEAAARTCPACARATAWLSYRGPADSADRHFVLHCAACGVLGQLPDGVAIRADGPLAPCRGGDALALAFEIESTRLTSLHGAFVAVRESWFGPADDATAPVAIAVALGARARLSLTLPIARGLAPGLYPITLLGVVNGGLVQIRRHVSVLEGA